MCKYFFLNLLLKLQKAFLDKYFWSYFLLYEKTFWEEILLLFSYQLPKIILLYPIQIIFFSQIYF